MFGNTDVFINTYMHTIEIDEKEAINLKEIVEGYIGERKGKGKMLSLKYNLKIGIAMS